VLGPGFRAIVAPAGMPLPRARARFKAAPAPHARSLSIGADHPSRRNCSASESHVYALAACRIDTHYRRFPAKFDAAFLRARDEPLVKQMAPHPNASSLGKISK